MGGGGSEMEGLGHCIVARYILRERHRLQNCSNGGTTISGPVRCEVELHGYVTGFCLFFFYAITTVFQ